MADCPLVVLWGDEQEKLGEIATASLDGATAVALSRGRFPKGYEYVDPNEDAVLAAAVPGGRRLLAAADGHNGFEAARAAMEAIGAAAPALPHAERDPGLILEDLFSAASAAIAAALASATGPRRWSRTALSLVLLDDKRAWTATLGDTVVLRVRRGRVTLQSRPGPFLGADTPPPRASTFRLRGGDRVVVATDGVTDYLGATWRQRLGVSVTEKETPLGAARRIVEGAMDGGAGDNCGTVVAYPQKGDDGMPYVA